MEQINSDRNKIAHGKESRELTALQMDILDFIIAIDWKNLISSYQLPSSGSLTPWIRKVDDSSDFDLGKDETVGIIEEWKAKGYEYIIPHKGEEFHKDFE